MDVLPIRQSLASEPSQSAHQLAGLDAVRAFAALGVVLLHAGAPYLTNPMKGLSWTVRDQASPLVDCLFWGIEVFIMPMFLVMAGFFAWRTITRRGPRTLVASRARRLLIPLLFGMVVVLPADLYIWVLSWVGEGLVPAVKLKSLKVDGELGQNLWGLSHLWFLQYLFLYVSMFALAFYATARKPRLIAWIPSEKACAFVLVSIGVVALSLRPEVVWGFQHSFAPVASKWIYSATFFAGGLLLAFQDHNLSRLRDVSSRLIAPAILLLFATVLLGRWQMSTQQQTASISLAAMTTASAWIVTLCTIGLAVKREKPIPVAIKYLAAASFWVYLVHHPLLGIIHTDLKQLFPSLAPAAKMVFAFGLSSILSLMMYEVAVRKTRLGRWLGFEWQIPVERQEQAQVTEQLIPVRHAA